VVIGTSMVVYPAAGLIDFVPKSAPIFLIDPNEVAVPIYRHIHFIKEKAGAGVKLLQEKLINEFLLPHAG
jgi:NAD-dependent deacetylase